MLLVQGGLWVTFKHHLAAAEEAENQHSQALERAKDCLSAAQFRSQVAQAECWTDLRLPQEGNDNYDEYD